MCPLPVDQLHGKKGSGLAAIPVVGLTVNVAAREWYRTQMSTSRLGHPVGLNCVARLFFLAGRLARLKAEGHGQWV